MCGLCGSYTQKGTVLSKRDLSQRARVIEGLLIANQVRGTDSAGIAAINYDGKYDLLKVAVDPWKFVSRKDSQALLRTDAPLMIGHTRMTSMGNDITDENAHPFVEGNVIGAHNGVINNWTQLDRTVNVDSQAVLRLIDKHPDAYDYVFPQVSGSCALTWWDGRDPEALFLVAHSNPLSVAIVPRIKTLFWSSISDHLETVMRTAYGTGVDHITIKKDTIYRISGDDIYEWQEEKVSFGTEAKFGSNVRVYNHGGFGWDDEDDYISQYYGVKSDPKAPASSLTVADNTLPASMSPEEEERYESFWMRMMEDSQSESESDSLNSDESARERLHELTEGEFDREAVRFEVDDLDGTLMCGYCEKSLGDRGVWDDGLQLILCRYCQKWWDEYGHYAENGQMQKYPLVTT